MQSSAHIAGMVVAGGRSTRFGGEKAIAPYAGQPMLLWAVRRLARVATQVAVNARPGSGAAALAVEQGLVLLHDMPGDPDGPLSGVRAGLAWASARGLASLAVSPCDVPLLPEDLFVRLAALAGDGAAMVETSEGRQPQCAIWPVSALPVLTAALAGGQHPPTWRMLEQIGAARLHVEPPGLFANINTREDLARLQAADHQQ